MRRIFTIFTAFALWGCTAGSMEQKHALHPLPANWHWENCPSTMKQFATCDLAVPLPNYMVLSNENADSQFFFTDNLVLLNTVTIKYMPVPKVYFQRVAAKLFGIGTDCTSIECFDYVFDRNDYTIARKTLGIDNYEFYIETPKHLYRVFVPDGGTNHPPRLTRDELKVLETSLFNLRIRTNE